MTPKFENRGAFPPEASATLEGESSGKNPPESSKQDPQVREGDKKEAAPISGEEFDEENLEPFDAENEKLVRRLQQAKTLADVREIVKTVEQVVMRDGSKIPGEEAATYVAKGDYHYLTEELEKLIGRIGRSEYYTKKEKGFVERKPMAWKEGDRFRSRRTGREFEIVKLYTRESTPFEGSALIKFARYPNKENSEMVKEWVPFKKLNRLLEDVEPVKLGGREIGKTSETKESPAEEWLGKDEPPAPSATSEVAESGGGWWGRVKGWFGR